MREVSPGDLVYSFAHTKIGAIGYATSYCDDAPKPQEFGIAGANWDDVGWKVDVNFVTLSNAIKPANHMDVIGPMLPDKYAPIQANGRGNQVYLCEIPEGLSKVLTRLIVSARNELPVFHPDDCADDSTSLRHEDEIANAIVQSDLPETEKEQLVNSRRGQGKFRKNVLKYENSCRVSGVSNARYLIASHIKPWRSSDNRERLDGENGLMLSPNIDHLFDRGFISFSADGLLLTSPVADREALERLGVPLDGKHNVGSFTAAQKRYLEEHRREVFKKAQ